MRILVYPHDLSIGGSQINAIDLAAGVAAAGHEVLVYGIEGPLLAHIERLGLRFIPARRLKYRPAPSRILQLASIARREKLDLIHGYEWPPCLDSYFGAGLMMGVPVVSTVLGMTVSPFIPRSVPLIMGTAELGAAAQRVHHGKVWVIEPPIDVVNDHPGIDGGPFRASHGVRPDDLLIVTVSRLAMDLKLDALVRAIDAVDLLAGRDKVRLVIVGGGPAHEALQARAAAVNRRWQRDVVTLAGPDLDPRSAYAAADVVVGMGSSAMRALAIGRPVVVQGERAFSEVFDTETLPLFLHQGFYGQADSVAGADRLARQIGGLLFDCDRRRLLGEFGRRVVAKRFSLQRAVQLQLEIYAEVVQRPVQRRLRDAVSSASRALMLEVHNHDPRLKQRRRSEEALLFASAKAGAWPPANKG